MEWRSRVLAAANNICGLVLAAVDTNSTAVVLMFLTVSVVVCSGVKRIVAFATATRTTDIVRKIITTALKLAITSHHHQHIPRRLKASNSRSLSQCVVTEVVAMARSGRRISRWRQKNDWGQ